MKKIWIIAGILGVAALLTYPVVGLGPRWGLRGGGSWGRGPGACWQAGNEAWRSGEARPGWRGLQALGLSASSETPGGFGRWDGWRAGAGTGSGT